MALTIQGKPCSRCGGTKKLRNHQCASRECRKAHSQTLKAVAKRNQTALTKTRDKALAKAGGVDVLFGYVEAGMTFTEMCGALGLEDTPLMRNSLRHLLRADKERYETAKEVSAEAHAERAGEVFGDKAPVTSADAKWRSDRSKWHQWMSEYRAGLLGKGPTVQVDIGQLHLAALQAHGHRNPQQQQQQRRVTANAADAFLANVQDAEVVTDEA